MFAFLTKLLLIARSGLKSPMPTRNGFEESWVGPLHRSRRAFQYQAQIHAATLDLQRYAPRGSEPRNGWNDLRNQRREVERYLNSVLVQIDPLDRVCGELLNLAENTSATQSCESFTYR